MKGALRLLVKAAGQASDHGTAWAIYPDLVVTAFHVVGDTSTRLWKHEETWRGACTYLLQGISTEPLEPLLYDPRADVAILRMKDPARLRDSCFLVPSPLPPMPGDGWYAEGYPDLPGLSAERSVRLGGVVQRASMEMSGNALQLHVRQGTAATWEGMSGSAVRNYNDEVIGIIAQTSKDVSMAHAAPVEVVERLLRLHDGAALAGRAVDLLRAAGDEQALAAKIAESMTWANLRLPLPALALRFAMEGGDGLLDLLARAEEQLGAVVPAAAELRAAILEAMRGDASEPDLVRVLQAIHPEKPGSEEAVVDATGGDLPPRVVTNAITRLIERKWAERRRDGTIELTAQGAKRAARREYVLAILRQLVGGARVSREALAERLPRIPPPSFSSALGCAIRAGWVEAQPGGFVRQTSAGEELVRASDRGWIDDVRQSSWQS